MSEYTTTRETASEIVSRFAEALENLQDDYEEGVPSMDHWHYQLMYHKPEKPQLGEEGYYAVHEYYDLEDGAGWTEEPVDVTGSSVDDVKRMLLCILKDLDKHGVKSYDD